MPDVDSPISPPLTPDTSLGSLSGYRLIVRCPKCGDREKDVDKLLTSPRMNATRIGDLFAKLSCSTCAARPTELHAECVWIRKYDRTVPRIDLTSLLPEREEAPQGRLFG